MKNVDDIIFEIKYNVNPRIDRIINEVNKKQSIRRGKAYMICFYFVAVGIMLSEFVRRVF